MNKWHELDIKPRDVLFFRDAKPMEASSIGKGANWPMPQVFHNALLTALHQKERQLWEKHCHKAGNSDTNKLSSFRFGGLNSVGIFPYKEELYFPCPADIQCLDDTGTLTTLMPGIMKGQSNLPAPLKYGLFKPGKPTKKPHGTWISKSNLHRYLNGETPLETVKKEYLYNEESRPGIAIDADTQSTIEGKFYIAEYMRLHDEISLRGFAKCRHIRTRDDIDEDVLEHFFNGCSEKTVFCLGGQQGLAFVERQNNDSESIVDTPENVSHKVKWVLLTPAIFTGGWLPSWICPETGYLKAGIVEKPSRRPGESRAAWRQRFKATGIKAQLVAACIPKPYPYSGWRNHGGRSEKEQGAQPTRLCVPAGSVYYFEIDKSEDPKRLITHLHQQSRSDILAEKGFGFGVCGTWEPFNEKDKETMI